MSVDVKTSEYVILTGSHGENTSSILVGVTKRLAILRGMIAAFGDGGDRRREAKPSSDRS